VNATAPPARRWFGTDGVRGKVGVPPITPDLVMRIAFAAGRVLAPRATAAGARPTVLIGKDTRVSGYMLEAAMQSGFAAAGVDVLLAGPMPTPAIAYLTRALRLSAGVVISASHNPYDDNGIKFFGADGFKLDDAVEAEIEIAIDGPFECAPSAGLGRARRVTDAAGRYIEFCKSTFPAELDLRGLRIVVDAANGAAWQVADRVLHELGAEVIAVGNRPDGFNINQGCGATHPEFLSAQVLAHRADLGLALDGDADRLRMADGSGRSYDGDELLYVISRHRRLASRLEGGVIGTLMSNFGFEQALGALGVPFARAGVGDRYVLELMKQRGWLLGGENSGHIVCLDKHTTGDGLISSLQVLTALRTRRETLPEATLDMTLLPQVLVNVRTERRFEFATDPRVSDAARAIEDRLAGRGRLLLRASGTEPVVRVMVEGHDATEVRGLAESLADVVREAARA
jgi:phosphoglucosamine mutase